MLRCEWLIAIAILSCGRGRDGAPPREPVARTSPSPSKHDAITEQEGGSLPPFGDFQGSPLAPPTDARESPRRTMVLGSSRLGEPEQPIATPAPTQPAPTVPPDPASAERCTDSLEVAIFRSPRNPHPGQPLRIIVVAEHPQPRVSLGILDPSGNRVEVAVEQGGGPPYWWTTRIERPRTGTYKVALGSGTDLSACEAVRVGEGPVRPTMDEGIWPSAWKWERDTENLYSAFIEHLFDAPVGESPTFRPLHHVLRDRQRNLLWGHLSLGEDEPEQRPPLVIAPDCADLAYSLRAYFAWKMQLPFGFSACTRGTATSPPRCNGWNDNREAPAEPSSIVMQFGDFLRRRVSWTVHSGSGRTLPNDDETDLYPLVLTREALRPGSVFADPYGHFLVLAKWIPQTPSSSGILFAIDGQPDGTVSRKRFWRGNFLFDSDLSVAGAGWKWFRPIGLRAGVLRPLRNREIAADPQYGNFSDEQYRVGTEGFYDRMERLMNPEPVDPMRAIGDLVGALREQLEARVRSVQNGEDYMAQTAGRQVSMPEGAEIFETTGAWEDYATPSRDMRVLIAMQVVLEFPERVARHPDAYAMPPGRAREEVLADVVSLRDRLTQEQSIQYRRTDGSDFTLSVSEVLSRRSSFEMAYNPNDCVEHRWAAPEGSAERSSCRRQSPADQVARMQRYRSWFANRRRPPRP